MPKLNTTATTTATSKPLSVAQLLVLTAAAQRPNHMVLPLPTTLRARGGGQIKLLTALLKAALVEEVPVSDDTMCWRRDADAQRIGLHLTAAGLTAVQAPGAPPTTSLGEHPEPASAPQQAAVQDTVMPTMPPATPPAQPAPPAPSSPPAHPGGKLGQVLSAVSDDTGATLAELVSLTGWQPHTARAALTGLRRRGFAVQLSEQLGRKAYRLATAA